MAKKLRLALLAVLTLSLGACTGGSDTPAGPTGNVTLTGTSS